MYIDYEEVMEIHKKVQREKSRKITFAMNSKDKCPSNDNSMETSNPSLGEIKPEESVEPSKKKKK
jgi:hypothetical protein